MIKVLVIDDDFMVAKVHSGFVNSIDGFAVVGVAHNGAEAVKAVESLNPALVLLDIHLPDINGWICCSSCERSNPTWTYWSSAPPGKWTRSAGRCAGESCTT